MQYEIYVRKTDLVIMNLLMLPRLPQTYLGYVFLVACAACGGIKELEKHGVLIWLSVSILIGTVIFLLVNLIIIFFQSITAAASKGTIGKTVYRFEDSFFIEETIGAETKTRWESIAGLYKFKKYIFVMINAGRVHIIPRREFPSAEEFECVYEKIARKVGQS